MKTYQEVHAARRVVNRTAVETKGTLRPEQAALLMGFSVALCWVCGDGGETLQRLLDGEQFAPKTDADIDRAFNRFRDGLQNVKGD